MDVAFGDHIANAGMDSPFRRRDDGNQTARIIGKRGSCEMKELDSDNFR
jgi:hypothetical protein